MGAIMSKHSRFTKGYYSILQYVPDPERAEGVNVGVALVCPEKGFLRATTSRDNNRIRRFFKNQEIDLKRLSALKKAFEERVRAEAGRIRTLEDFQHFIDTRANQLRLTPPRPVKVESPELELINLFESLVEDKSPTDADHTTLSKTEIKNHFRELIRQYGLSDKVREKVTYDLPVLGKSKVYPFGFRNGQPNVVNAVSFEAVNEQQTENLACRVVVEGQDLSRLPEPVRLNVIGSFRPEQQDRAAHIRHLLEENNIALCTADEIEKLVEEIAATAH
jgi:hypothetical protein